MKRGEVKLNYYWVRIFDYQHDKELSKLCYGEDNKGTLLDEYYLYGENLSREDCKSEVKEKSNVDLFSKPRNGKCGIYAIVLNSEKHWYDRFMLTINTLCFNCHKPILGHEKDFPSFYPINYDKRWYDNGLEYENKEYDEETKYYFCSYDCKYQTISKLQAPEGEWQTKEDYKTNGGIYGYIYHIYNRQTNKHYIGQTLFMPFFRWQEHAKQNIKGDICDLVFETICKVSIKSQQYLNSIEAWWIQRYISEYGKENVMNLTIPKITVENLVNKYKEMNREVIK